MSRYYQKLKFTPNKFTIIHGFATVGTIHGHMRNSQPDSRVGKVVNNTTSRGETKFIQTNHCLLLLPPRQKLPGRGPQSIESVVNFNNKYWTHGSVGQLNSLICLQTLSLYDVSLTDDWVPPFFL